MTTYIRLESIKRNLVACAKGEKMTTLVYVEGKLTK